MDSDFNSLSQYVESICGCSETTGNGGNMLKFVLSDNLCRTSRVEFGVGLQILTSNELITLSQSLMMAIHVSQRINAYSWKSHQTCSKTITITITITVAIPIPIPILYPTMSNAKINLSNDKEIIAQLKVIIHMNTPTQTVKISYNIRTISISISITIFVSNLFSMGTSTLSTLPSATAAKASSKLWQGMGSTSPFGPRSSCSAASEYAPGRPIGDGDGDGDGDGGW